MTRGRVMLSLASALVVACAAQIPVPVPVPVPAPNPPVPRFLNQDPSVAYIGREACQGCHLPIAATYAETGMGRAFVPLTPDTRLEGFDGDEFVEERSGLRYRMFRRDGHYVQRQFMLDSSGRETAVQEHELLWVIGSNQHNRTFLIEDQGKLFQGPLCWFPSVARWDWCPGFEHKNDDYTREISASCAFCHNGVMRLLPGERNAFERPYPHGIGCERCHGPGQVHRERWTVSNDLPGGGVDPTIIEPRRLTPARRLDVCAQCHLGDAAATERVARHGKRVEDYRPAQALTDYLVPFRYAEPTEWDFGLSAQVDRLLLSRCFKESGGALDCLTCHDPHVSVYRGERPADFFDAKCLSCHAKQDCQGQAAVRQATTPPDHCVGCHMRTAEPDDLRHTTFTDHWIRRDPHPTRRDPRQRFDIEPVFPQAFAALSAGEQAYHRARAHGLLAPDAPPSARPEMWQRAAAGLTEAIGAGFDVADAWFFLGKARWSLGQLEGAVDAFEAAVSRDPTHADATFALAQLLVAKGDTPRALALFGAMLERDPGNAMALAETGRARFGAGQLEQALAAYRQAVRAEPWNPTLRLNLGMALAAAGRYDEAREAGEAAAARDPESTDVWEFLVNLDRAAGRPDGAAEAQRTLERLQRRH